MTICQVQGCQEHYGCQLKNKGIRLSTAAIPNRPKRVSRNPGIRAQPSWEKGVVGEHRPDGTFMPVIRPGGPITTPLGIKEYSENRHHFDERIRSARQGALQ